MSQKNQPVISATIYYYDDIYSVETAQKVLSVLERHQMFPPHKIHIGKLTRNRFVLANDKTRSLFVQGYREKDVFGIDMASADSRTALEYWRIDWGFTYYKNSQLTGPCIFKPWNTFTIQSTFGRLRNDAISRDFISCIKELIAIFNPFYASIDDLSNKVSIMDRTKERRFIPERIQAIYWGNYLGSEHCKHLDVEYISQLPIFEVERINDGIYFTLSRSVLECKEISVERLRRQVGKLFMKHMQTDIDIQ